ncbi:MAG: D-aminoacyl-tRNA deacylase [Peptococcaceae bacterium]|nr:D-aminoacyl-tRNA deacylase [Peptococcaceae bacterium]
MRAVIQRVQKGRVAVAGHVTGEIATGLVILLGVGNQDQAADAKYLADKIWHLRIFADNAGKINNCVQQVDGEILVVSQFTLMWDCRKGRRPSFDQAAAPEYAKQLYEYFIACLRELGARVATGEFQAHMLVEIANDGPVTVLLDSKKEF